MNVWTFAGLLGLGVTVITATVVAVPLVAGTTGAIEARHWRIGWGRGGGVVQVAPYNGVYPPVLTWRWPWTRNRGDHNG